MLRPTIQIKMQAACHDAAAILLRRHGNSRAPASACCGASSPGPSSSDPTGRRRQQHLLLGDSPSSLRSLRMPPLAPSRRHYHTLHSAAQYCRRDRNDDGSRSRSGTSPPKRHKVFVSRHNQTLHLTPAQITSYLGQQLPHLHDDASSFRTTSTHVILKECPFCSKPTHNRPDNHYKLYIALGHGAYFCHRCGASGSWYDFKSELGGFRVDNVAQQTGRSRHLPPRYNCPSNLQHSRQPNVLANSTKLQPLPMPHPKLNSIHSSNLFCQSPSQHSKENLCNSHDDPPSSHAVMMYLQQTRGLHKRVLLKYGVGCATYKFPSSRRSSSGNNNNNGSGMTTTKMEYVSSTCVTFPWLMRQGEVEEQEKLRGAKYVWKTTKKKKEEVGMDTTLGVENNDMCDENDVQPCEDEEESNTENIRNNKTNHSQPRLEMMTALERYNAKRERQKKKLSSSSPRDSSNGDIQEDRFQSTSPRQEPEREPQPRTTTTASDEEMESLHGPYITRRIKARSIDQKSWQRLDPPGGGFGLFGWHTVPPDASEIIVTEGEFDAMAVFQSTGRPAVSLPNGCRSLPMEVLVLLERFDTIYLWMDNDRPGREGAEMFARKLGVERCLLVQPSGKRGWKKAPSEEEDGEEDDDGEYGDGRNGEPPPSPPKDANEALLMGWDLNELLNEASELPHERILKFSDLRDQVIHEITNPDKYRGVPIPSLPGFTSLIKGFRRGEMTVLTGPTGSGKTTFLGQTSLDLAEQGVNVLWGSFEIKNTRLMQKLLQQYTKDILPVGLAERELSADEKKKMYEALTVLADKFESLPMYFMKFHGGSDIDDVLDAMEYAAYVHDVEHVILDNMQFMISRDIKKMTSSFDKFDMQDIAIEKFRKFATDYNVHVTLVVHPRKEDEGAKLGISSFYGSAKATQEADTVLILQSDGKRKFVDVKKNRFDGTLGHVPLYFERKSGRYTEDAGVSSSPPKRTVIPNGVNAISVGQNGGRAVASSTYADIRSQHPIM